MLTQPVIKAISFLYKYQIPQAVIDLVKKDGNTVLHKDGIFSHDNTKSLKCTLNVLASSDPHIRDEQRAVVIRDGLLSLVVQHQILAVI